MIVNFRGVKAYYCLNPVIFDLHSIVYVRNASYSDKYIVSRSRIRKSERKQTGPVDRSTTVFAHVHIFASKISISGDWQMD